MELSLLNSFICRNVNFIRHELERKLLNLSVFRFVTTLNVNSIPHEEENAKLVCSSSNLH